jgi:hypothetical protein
MIQCNTFGCFYGSKIEPYKIPEASYEITITISDIFEQIILNKRKRGIHTGN